MILFLIGFLSIFLQSFLLREFYLTFSGNELTSGILIAGWLIWTGIGALLGRKRGKLQTYLIVFAYMLPIEAMILYNIRMIFHLWPGEVAGIPHIFITSFIFFAPLFFLLGAIFARGIKEWIGGGIKGFTRPYMLEAFGDLVGGLFFTYIALIFIPIYLRYIFASIVAIIIVLIKQYRVKRYYILLLPFLGAIPFSKTIYKDIIRKNFPGYSVFTIFDSPISRYIGLEKRGIKSVIQDGNLIFSYPEKSTEEDVHIPFLFRKGRENKILYIGLPSPGIIKELKKEGKVSVAFNDPAPLKKIGYHINFRYIPRDGRLFLKGSKEHFDFIVLGVGEVDNISSNRFFTTRFIKLAKRALTTGGIIFLKIPSNENYISGPLLSYTSTVFSSFHSIFPYYFLLPGENLGFLFSTSPLIMNKSYAYSKLDSLNTTFLNRFTLPFRFQKERVDYVKNKIIKKRSINTDDNLKLFFESLLLWGQKYSKGFEHILKFLSLIPIFIPFILFSIPLISRGIKYRIFLLGGLGISTEILSIIILQIIYGNLYHIIGMIVGLFMFGLGVGAYVFEKFQRGGRGTLKLLFLFASVIILVLFPIMRFHLSLIFLILLVNLLFGIVVGYTYGVGTKLLKGASKDSAAVVYSFDLMGAAIGSIFTTLYFIPVYGISPTILLLVGLGILGFIL